LKGAGYCLNYNCLSYIRPHFVMGMDESYRCIVCAEWGYLEKNAQSYEGSGLINSVTVHFKYDVVSRSYKAKAIVTDVNLPGKRMLNVYRPFIHFDKSALMLAEKALADVASGHSGLTIDFDMDKKEFQKTMDKLSESLQSEYLRADLGSGFVSLGEQS